MNNLIEAAGNVERYLAQIPRRKLYILLFSIVFLIYLPSVKNGFVYDDEIIIKGESLDLSLGSISKVFSEPHYPFLPYYRPITRLTFIAQKQLTGLNPFYFHLINITLASVLAVVVFALLTKQIFKISKLFAFIGTLLFVVHPVTSSSIYPIASGRENLLPTIFFISTLYFYLHKGKYAEYLAIIFFFLATFSKESTLILLPIIIVMDALHQKHYTDLFKIRKLKAYLPYLFILLIYLLVRWKIFSGSEIVWGKDILNIISVPVYALQTSVFPFWDLHYEPFSIKLWLRPVNLLGATFLLSAILYLYSKVIKKAKKTASFWLTLFLVSLLPTANILKQDAPFSERYILLSLFALIGILLMVASNLNDSKVKNLIFGSLLLVISSFVVFSIHRASFFKSDLAFFSQWTLTSPDYYLPYFNLGRTWQDLGDLDKAEGNYLKGIELNPEWSSTYINLAGIYILKGEYEKSLPIVEKYISLEPDSSQGYYHEGLAHLLMGNYELAIESFITAAEISPDFVEAYNNLGNSYYSAGRLEDAQKAYEKALELDPTNVDVQENLEKTKLD